MKIIALFLLGVLNFWMVSLNILVLATVNVSGPEIFLRIAFTVLTLLVSLLAVELLAGGKD